MTRIPGDVPLIAFTALATSGAGILVAGPLLAGFGLAQSSAGGTAWGAGLLALGLLVSSSHLGRPRRMGLAVLGVARSPLSNEALLAVATTGAAGVALLMGRRDAVTVSGLQAGAGLLGLALLVSLGLVYRLGGQLTWGGASVLSPAALGLAFGTLFLTVTTQRIPRLAALVLLVVDAGLFAVRSAAILRLSGPSVAAHPKLFVRARPLLGLRFLLVDVGPALWLGLGWAEVALGVLASGVLADRILFYGLAAQRTTEAQVRDVEAAIEADGASCGTDRGKTRSRGDGE